MASVSKSKRLKLIAGLAAQALAKAGERLQAAGHYKDQQEEQLLNLQSYRKQYIESMRDTLQGQNNAYRLASYQKFILQLAEAITQQQGIYELASKQYEVERQAWVNAREKHKSMLRIAEQTYAQEQALALKQDEARLMDDFMASKLRR